MPKESPHKNNTKLSGLWSKPIVAPKSDGSKSLPDDISRAFFPFCQNFCSSDQVKNSYPRSILSELKRNQSEGKLEISTYPHTSNQFIRMAYMKSILIFFRFGIDI